MFIKMKITTLLQFKLKQIVSTSNIHKQITFNHHLIVNIISINKLIIFQIFKKMKYNKNLDFTLILIKKSTLSIKNNILLINKIRMS